MADFGMGIATQIVAEVAVKCIEIGWHVIQNAKLYLHEENQFSLRLRAQVGIWNAIHEKLSEGEIQARIRPSDIATYFAIMQELHKLMRKYVERDCKDQKVKEEVLTNSSLEKLISKWETGNVLKLMTEEAKEQNMGFWLRVKDETAWAVWRKEKNEKLVTEIERWGLLLDRFSSWTLPTMFPKPTTDNIAMIADPRLHETAVKAQVMLAKSIETTRTEISGLTLAEQGTFILDKRRIAFPQGGGIFAIAYSDRHGCYSTRYSA